MTKMKNVTNARTPGFYWPKYFHFSKSFDPNKSCSTFSVIEEMSAQVEATRKRRSTFVCQFCNAIVATTFGTKDAFEKHMEETHDILTNLNVVMAIHTMTEEEK